MLRFTCLLVLSLLAATGMALAQSDPPVVPGQQIAAKNAKVTLTRQRAEQLALKNNPRIRVAALLALAQKQVVREARSAELPIAYGNVTVEGAEEASRLSSGALSASRLLNHVGAGLQVSQLITDFGRTRNLVAASSLHEKEAEQNTEATRDDIALVTDLAFYNALEAQATLKVATSTVDARQTVGNQVDALTASKLKSTLDQSFAQVNLSQAKLLALDSQNQADAAMARLNEILGTADNTEYELVDDPGSTPPLPLSADAVIATAMQQRPDLKALQFAHDADIRLARAQRDQLLPTISGLGVVGSTPVGSSTYFPQNWYGAAGVNMNIPIFDGFKFHAQVAEAELRAKASSERTRELADVIARDVRTAWLAAKTAQQRMGVTGELVKQADSALDLAQTRYQLGLSSIVELSQAQLQETEAQIANANARFEYEADLAAIRFQSGAQP